MTTDIPGYTYGSASLQKSPVSMDDFAKLKQAALFSDDDVRYLKMSHDILKDQTEQILDVWYGFVGSTPFLFHYFTNAADGQPNMDYLGAVRKRFGQWILDTAKAEYDQPTPFERLAWLKTQEQFILTMTTVGLGKRASAYEYRVTNRGGKGLIAHKLTGDARIVASFPLLDQEELLLVTDKGQLIRTAIDQIRIAGRATQGVILINVSDDEHVVAAERLEALGGDRGEAGEAPEAEGEGEAK